jgi:ribonuclease HII
MNAKDEAAMRRFLASDASYVIGIDEVGLGAWAGPLVVAGVMFQKGWGDPRIKDSKMYAGTKKLTAHEQRREVLNTVIKPAQKFGRVEKVTSEELDRIGVQQALDAAIYKVARACFAFFNDSIIVVDGARTPTIDFVGEERLIVLPKADALIPAVAAASVAAKVARDSAMQVLSRAYPEYGFAKHVGYGTKEHREAIEARGLTPLHRRSYKPIRQFMKQ